MNEMYMMSIGIHDFGVLGLLMIVFGNSIILLRAGDIHRYAKQMRIMMPVSGMLIATIIFTGMVMMAAKRLDFTIENSVMIVFSIALIVLESKRYGALKHIDLARENVLLHYKRKAGKILAAELVVTLLISVWMLLK